MSSRRYGLLAVVLAAATVGSGSARAATDAERVEGPIPEEVRAFKAAQERFSARMGELEDDTRAFVELREGEEDVYDVAVESPRGEIGCYLVSDGTAKPNRLHIRGPSFYNLQSMDAMVPGGMFADAVAVVSSIDPIMGEVDR